MEQEILSRWFNVVEDFQLSPSEFYNALEGCLKRRDVPDLKIYEVEHKEGGLLSAGRIYLRLKRERLWFDVCSSPFGNGYFFSSWFVRRKNEGSLTHVVLLVLLLVLIGLILTHTVSFPFALATVSAIALCLVYTMRNTAGSSAEAVMLAMPLIGPIYERYFCPLTYYRIDTMQMYQQVVHTAVIEAVNEVTTKKGRRPLTELECKPFLSDILKA